MTVEEKIIEIVAEQAVLEPGDLTLQSRLEDLGLDSLGLVEAVFAIEEEYNISVPFNANEPDKTDFDFTSVETITKAVEALIAEQTG